MDDYQQYLQHTGQVGAYTGPDFNEDHGRINPVGYTPNARFESQRAKAIERDGTLAHESAILDRIRDRFNHLVYMNPLFLMLAIRVLCKYNGMPDSKQFGKFVTESKLLIEERAVPDFFRYVRTVNLATQKDIGSVC